MSEAPTFTKLIELTMMENPEFAEKMHYWAVKRKRMPESQYILSYIIATFGPKQTTELLTEIIEYVQKSSQPTEPLAESTEPLTEPTEPPTDPSV